MNELSALFESLAIGVLDLCYYEDTMKAQALLRVRGTLWPAVCFTLVCERASVC